jgi:undecaprenyl-diphosphatase
MEYIEAILLGILQGISEFLPISSSGHLVLAEALFGLESEGITFEVVVHFGTLFSILIFYRKILLGLIKGVWKQLTLWISEPSSRKDANQETQLAGFILLSMIPAMLVGLLLKDQIESLFDNPVAVSIFLLITGTLLFSTRFTKGGDGKINVKRALAMGVAQAFAVLPGISRAGSTIAMGLFYKTDREEAATFSFLMVLPVIAGAMLLETIELLRGDLSAISAQILFVGFISAFISGYLSLGTLIQLLKKQKFYLFSLYCWVVGIFGLIWFSS